MEDLDASEQVIVDGTLSPCRDWNEQSGLFSGKHRRTGVNLQVVADLTGRLLQVSRPAPGSTHDAKAIKATGLLEHFKNTPPLADKGYVGLGLLTPDRKPAGAELTKTQKKATGSSIRCGLLWSEPSPI
ncbi:MAG: transposase family protein [Propionibacterium acidifaciens]|uniref:transposase family protein n=1 Tax=Propionibacterium acidifaciens TaxID=556499 RepID=UPI003610271F